MFACKQESMPGEFHHLYPMIHGEHRAATIALQKSHDARIRKRRLLFFFGILMPLTFVLSLCLARPALPLKSFAFMAIHLGFRDTAGKLDKAARLCEAEQEVRERFNDVPVWIELPNTHHTAFATSYLNSFEEPGSIALFPTSPTTFKACVPSKMSAMFTVEKLGESP